MTELPTMHSAADALQRIEAVRKKASALGVSLREPPPVPTTCCGRGCNGCVWEGYFAAVHWWLEDAGAQPGL